MHNVRVLERVYFWQPSAARRAKTSISFELRIRRVATATAAATATVGIAIDSPKCRTVGQTAKPSQAKRCRATGPMWTKLIGRRLQPDDIAEHRRTPLESL